MSHASWIWHSLRLVAATNFRDKPSWLVAFIVWNVNWQSTALRAPCSFIFCTERVSEQLNEWLSEGVSEVGYLSLPQSAPVAQLLPFHPSESITRGSCSCRQSLVFPRLMGILDGGAHLEWFSWPLTSHTLSLILYLALGPNGLGTSWLHNFH